MQKSLLAMLALSGILAASPKAPAQTVVQQFAAISSGAGDVSDMDLDPTAPGSILIAMPGQLSPDIKIMSVTDNAPAGGNTYKQVRGASSSCATGPLEIWYCEKCNPGVTELKFHLSGHTRASINSFMEVQGLALTSTLDGDGVQLSNATSSATGSEAGPSIKTKANDFIVARFASTPPLPTAVTPAGWTYKTSYIYRQDASPGTYQPTLTGAKPGVNYCMSVAAFKTAAK